MTIIDKIKLWDTSALSLVCEGLLDLEYCCTIEFRPHNCESGKWIDVKIEKDGEKWGGIGGSTLSVTRKRLIDWAEKTIPIVSEIRKSS